MSEPLQCQNCHKAHDFRTDQVELKSEWGGTARCMTSDGRNINMADELNRLERKLIYG